MVFPKGQARTTMDDVAVLCRICHARAHKNGNDVIPLEKLREIANEKDRGKQRTLIRFY
jgi:predicted HNH restriction endonuclease